MAGSSLRARRNQTVPNEASGALIALMAISLLAIYWFGYGGMKTERTPER